MFTLHEADIPNKLGHQEYFMHLGEDMMRIMFRTNPYMGSVQEILGKKEPDSR
jgi:hypothetical protein